MKKILFYLFIFLAFTARGQDVVPADTAYHALPTYSFKYYTKDSSVWIYKGAKYKTTKLVSNIRMNQILDSLGNQATIVHSSGVGNGNIVYVTAGTLPNKISVVTGSGFIRKTNSQQGELIPVTWRDSVDIYTMPAPAAGMETVIFIGIDYAGGKASAITKTALTDFNWYSNFPLARVSYDGTDVYIINAYAHAEDTPNHTRQYLRKVFGFNRENAPEGTGGLELGANNRQLSTTGGKVWLGFNNYTFGAFALGHTFDVYYRKAGGGHNVSTATEFPNTQYDNGSGTLQDLTNNRYGTLWAYLSVGESHVHLVYGAVNAVSVALAQADVQPVLPDHLTYGGMLIARIIFQKSGAAATLIESAWATNFSASAVGNHALLSNLQGGKAGEYYHLTSSQRDTVLTAHQLADTLRNKGRASRWDVFGARVTNILPKYNTDSTFVVSKIFDNGLIHINGTAPDSMLTITGGAHFTTGLKLDMATGKAPLTVASTTVNTNFNADLLDGRHVDYLARRGYVDSTFTVKNDSSKYYKFRSDSILNAGYFTNWKALQYRKLNDHDSLSTLQEKSYNSLTDKPTLTSGTVTSVATGLGLSGGTITSTGTIILDTANVSVLSRQRAVKEYQPKGTYSTDIHANITALNAVSGANTGDNATNTQYSGLVTNANHSGDATGATALTLATVNSNVGTYTKVTINGKGLATAGATATTYDITPTANRGFITPADSVQLDNLSANLSSKVALADSTGGGTGKYATGKALSNHAALASTTSTSGHLSSTDWNTFNGKQAALTNPVTGTGTTNYIPKFTGTSTVGNSQIFDNGTNVGIGTINPSSKITVDNGDIQIRTGYSLFFRPPANDYDMGIRAVSTPTYQMQFGSASFSTIDMSIGINGKVGIGTTNPTEKLHVVGNGYFTTKLMTPTIELTTGAAVNKVWQCTNATTGAGQWATALMLNDSVQALSGTTPAWNATRGVNATLTLSGNTTITLSNLRAGTSGNIKITNPATVYTLTLSGYTNKISASVYSAANVLKTSGGSKIDVHSWWYDGTNLIWNGSLNYQ